MTSGTPPRPDVSPLAYDDRRPSAPIWLGLVLVLIAWGLTVPAFVQSLDWSGLPEDPRGPESWAAGLLYLAFPVGLGGLWALRHRSGRTAIQRERKAVQIGLLLSVVGATLWSLVFGGILNASM
jgi:hypothetical protein